MLYLQNPHQQDKLVAILLHPGLVAAEHALGPLVVDLLLLDKLRGAGAGRALGLGLQQVQILLFPLQQVVMKHVWVIPDLTADSKCFEGIGDTSVGDQLLHESSVQSPLDRGHLDEEDVLSLDRRRVLQDDVAAPLDEALELLVEDVGSMLHQPHILGSGVAALAWGQGRVIKLDNREFLDNCVKMQQSYFCNA